MMIRRASGCHPDRGVLLNAAATAGARLVEAEEALRRAPRGPERIAERLTLEARVATRRGEEHEAREAIERWEMHVWSTTRGGCR